MINEVFQACTVVSHAGEGRETSIVKLLLKVYNPDSSIVKEYFLAVFPQIRGRSTRFHDGMSKFCEDSVIYPLFYKGIKTIPCIIVNIGRFWTRFVDVIFHAVCKDMNVEELNP